MSNSNVLISFSLFFLFISFTSSSFNAPFKCSFQQTLDLLIFKENMSSINHHSKDYKCQDWVGRSRNYPIMMNWNKNTDCCKWDGVTCNHLTVDVIGIDLSCGMLQGTIHPNTTLFRLPHLQTLNLAYNDFCASQLPHAFSNNLAHLNMSHCGLVGSLPKSLVNLRHLTTLDLSFNKLNGTLPSLLFTLPLIEDIDLGFNMFSGGLPSELFNYQSLKKLSLQNNQFDGKINIGSTPPSSIQLANLTYLDLSWNIFTGLWKLETLLSSLPNLLTLDLSYSGLSVMNNNGTNYVNPELWYLGLASCNLTVFPESLRAMKNLHALDLSNNNIHGHVPHWAQEIGGNELFVLDPSNNSITGLPQFQWTGIEYMYLQSNQIQGPFPPSICNMKRLKMLDISDNSFSGMIPQCLGNISSSLEYLNVNSNQIQGPFPSSICNMSRLRSLDLSNNNFDGVIPQCLENISSTLMMVDMGNNHFHGIIPNMYKEFGQLQGLILNGNRLQGEVPSSLSKCQSLMVLDLGNNRLTGTLPGWLGDLPNLQVLVLKSNNLHGSIETSSANKSAFPRMRVLDLSHNEFVGLLPRKYFQSFDAMKNVVKNNTLPEYLYIWKFYSMVIAVKGVEQLFPKLFTGYTIVDLSNNRFEGDIPGVIGRLTSLKVLNLSHNSLTGKIPSDLGNLLEIESLDLSSNQLTGDIPQSLADITTLEVLNLSQNNLVGRIPHGTQFNTFNTSFEGNPKLCGFPLPKKCELRNETQLEVDGVGVEDGESGFTWRVVMLGYGCGTTLGLLMGYLMLSTGRPKWFNVVADAGVHMIQNKR